MKAERNIGKVEDVIIIYDLRRCFRKVFTNRKLPRAYQHHIIPIMRTLTSSALLMASASAFTTSLAPPHQEIRTSTALFADTRPPSSSAPVLSYGEESRKYRRTVYTHEDWVSHRSPDRFIRNILSTGSSGIYKNVGREVTAVVSVAVMVMLWNMATLGYTDFQGVDHEAIFKSNVWTPAFTIPMQAFTLPSSFLGLLLGE
jgi:putative membrane protein